MQTINRHSLLIIISTAILGVLLASFFAWQSHVRLVQVEESIISIHASLLANNVPSAYSVLQACGNDDQARFDELLSNLETISPAELQSLKILYPRCAYSLPIMQRVQLETMKSLYTLRNSYTQDFMSLHTIFPRASYRQQLFNELQSLQVERVTKSEELYSIQESIIDLRLAMVPLSSESYASYQSRAAQINADLSVLQTNLRQVLTAYHEL